MGLYSTHVKLIHLEYEEDKATVLNRPVIYIFMSVKFYKTI